MASQQQCARIGCREPGTYAKPLCYQHWKEFDRHSLDECLKCHWFFDLGDSNNELYDPERDEIVGNPDLCPACNKGSDVDVHAHAPVEHQTRNLYILKLDGGEFYVGQTNSLNIRIKEHRDGQTLSTKGKNPILVWFDEWNGDTKELNAEETALTLAAIRQPRRIRRMIEEWQAPLRLVDLNA